MKFVGTKNGRTNNSPPPPFGAVVGSGINIPDLQPC